MKRSNDNKEPLRYGITPLVFIAFRWLLIPALAALLIPVIFRLMKWLFE